MKTFLKKSILLSLMLILFGIAMPFASASDGFTDLYDSYVVGGNNGIPGRQTGTTPPGSSTTSVTYEPSGTVTSGPVNPLTGLPMSEVQAGRRPLAITLGNTTEALPMNGISQADIIYEVLVEGGLTRMVALYQDISNVGVIGSIRSARHYTAQIAESHDAIFISAGGSYLGYEEIEARGITHINELSANHNQMFQRQVHRIPGRTVLNYHSAITTGALAAEWMPRFDIRLEHRPNHMNALSFVNDATPTFGGNAANVAVRFSAGKSSTFSYDHTSRVYTMRQFNMDFVDANNNAPVTFNNLLILRTSVTAIPGDTAGLREVVTTGYGMGFFVSGGMYTEIFWFRPDKSSPFVYALRDGSELRLSQGRTYIGIIPDNMEVTFN